MGPMSLTVGQNEYLKRAFHFGISDCSNTLRNFKIILEKGNAFNNRKGRFRKWNVEELGCFRHSGFLTVVLEHKCTNK